jgi:ABC-type sugar transport system ATPase subunit
VTGDDHLLRASGLTKTYGALTALSDASISLRPGEVRALVGANGAGKSTLIKILTGAVRPTAGTIEVGGQTVAPGDPRRMLELGIACIYQHSNLAPAMSVLDNLYLGRQPTRGWGLLDRRRQRADAEALLRRYEIDLDLDAKVGELTTVKRKEVEIAKALALDARILLMDEPTAWLSHSEVERLFRTIRRLRSQGVGIVYISHILDELFAICDTVTILRDGRVVEDCRVAEITRLQLVRKFIGEKLAAEASDRSEATRHPRGTGEVRLACENLTKDGVFADISFEVCAGEIFCVTGLIGAKRSELMRAIFGADGFDAGRILVRGKEVTPGGPIAAIERSIGFVPEDRHRDGLMLRMSVGQNLAMAILGRVSRFGLLRSRRLSEVANRQIAELRIVPTNPGREVRHLSGGNQQKVLIGKWLERSPDILILDEPTVGVDVGAKSELYAILRRLRDAGCAVLVVSSDMEEVMAIADRIMVMRSGRVQGIYEAGKVTEQEIVAYVGGE